MNETRVVGMQEAIRAALAALTPTEEGDAYYNLLGVQADLEDDDVGPADLNTVKRVIGQILAAQRALEAVALDTPSNVLRPPTHRLVPVVPTEAMIDALNDALDDCHDSKQALILAIDAAPDQRQGADSPCAEEGSSAPSTDPSDPASQGGLRDDPSDERHGVAQSAPATLASEPVVSRPFKGMPYEECCGEACPPCVEKRNSEMEDGRITFIRNQAIKAIPQPHHHGEAPPPTWDDVRLLLAELDRRVDVTPKMAIPHVFTSPTCCYCKEVIDFKGGQQAHGKGDTGGDFRWWHYPGCPSLGSAPKVGDQ